MFKKYVDIHYCLVYNIIKLRNKANKCEGEQK